MSLYFNTAAVTPVLKNRYTKKKIETLAFQSAAVGMVPKDGNYGGALYVGAIRNAVTSSIGASDAVAFQTGAPSTYKQWQCQWFNAYGSANITGAAIDQSRGDPNALVDGMTSEFDGVFIGLGINLGGALWGNGGGAIGQISTTSSVSSVTITLANINDIVKFYVGQILQASLDDGTGGNGLRSGGATALVTGVNVSTGTVTFAAALNTLIATVAAGDYLFMQSDYNARFPGVAAWIPNPTVNQSTSTLYTAFNGVNRTSDPTRLAGVQFSGNGRPKSETMVQLLTLQNRMGGKPTDLYVNPVDYADLLTELQTRATIAEAFAYDNPQVSFKGAKVATPYGDIKLMQDVFVPGGFGWSLNLAEWLLPSMGDVPKVIGEGTDGQEWLRVAGLDAYQLRACYRCALYCAAPGHQAVAQW